MALTDEQKRAVSGWVSEGLGLSEIQQKIREAFGISMTYMDVRFLIIDLGVAIKDKVSPKPPAPPSVDADEGVEEDAEDIAGDEYEPAAPPGGGSARIELDRVMKAGSVFSGTVTFSDGVTAAWALDQLGRLALDAGRSGYRPSEADLRAFQVEFRKILEKRGY